MMPMTAAATVATHFGMQTMSGVARTVIRVRDGVRAYVGSYYTCARVAQNEDE